MDLERENSNFIKFRQIRSLCKGHCPASQSLLRCEQEVSFWQAAQQALAAGVAAQSSTSYSSDEVVILWRESRQAVVLTQEAHQLL